MNKRKRKEDRSFPIQADLSSNFCLIYVQSTIKRFQSAFFLIPRHEIRFICVLGEIVLLKTCYDVS